MLYLFQIPPGAPPDRGALGLEHRAGVRNNPLVKKKLRRGLVGHKELVV
jgi:hypothetical protein